MEKFIVCNYESLGKFKERLLKTKIDHFILDEAHGLKNIYAGKTRVMSEIIENFPNARVTLLSGTPIKNRVDDAFSYLRLTHHELGRNHKQFLQEYTIRANNRGGERVTGGKNLNDLHLKLMNLMIRETQANCLDVPEKMYIRYTFKIDDYRDEYNKIIRESYSIKYQWQHKFFKHSCC
jgi:SNF2 family DNA or RNA helicase